MRGDHLHLAAQDSYQSLLQARAWRVRFTGIHRLSDTLPALQVALLTELYQSICSVKQWQEEISG